MEKIKRGAVLRWAVILLCLGYIAYLHLERTGYRGALAAILQETGLIRQKAYYRTAPKDLKARVTRIGEMSSEVLNIPSNENTLREISDKSR
ncbi:MAG: hypothetical protein GF408_00830 [Candidatus Omnitrophica bacterium]|nr:hypothetical protein [Candidatus Omnitrophota bacterium]